MPTRNALVVGCALLVVACGCSTGSGKPAPTTVTTTTTITVAPSSTTTSSTQPVASTSTTTTTTVPTGLALLLPKTVPSGFPLQPDSFAETGPTDLNKAIDDDVLAVEPSVARRVLVSAGFVTGYQRQWGATGDSNYLWLYQFATPAGATAYVRHWQTELANQPSGLPLRPFSPLFVPGGQGLRGADKFGSAGIVLFAKGPYAVQASAYGEPKVDQSGPSSQLAAAEYALLP